MCCKRDRSTNGGMRVLEWYAFVVCNGLHAKASNSISKTIYEAGTCGELSKCVQLLLL